LTLLYRDWEQVVQKTIKNFNYIQDEIDNGLTIIWRENSNRGIGKMCQMVERK